MDLSRFESLTLIAAVLGAAVLDSGTHALGLGSAAVGDLAILLVLFAFDASASRSSAQSIAFAGATGFCVLTPILFVAKAVLGAAPPIETSWFVFAAWIIATLISFGVDRFRMSAQDNVSLAGSGLAGAPATPIISTGPPTGYRPAPIRAEPPAPSAYAPPAYAPPAYAPPVYTPPVYAPPAPVAYTPPAYIPPPPPPPPAPAPTPSFVTEPPAPAPDFSATSFSTPVVQPAAVQPAYAPPPPPDVTAIPPGREALIYLNLVGEGLNVLRTVRAENLGRDYYRIADVMPEGEQWEFTPGQVVKCRKKALSNGKHMVAYEEAPRAQ